jgi:RNA 2',3'-cyclic 3'-phosphodiesterase
VRLFVAAIPPPALAQRLAEAAASIALPELRLTPPANLHVTIHFLGEVEPDAVPALEADLAAAAAPHTPTELTLDAITPGPPRRPRMLWATAKATPGYTVIVGDVGAATAARAPNARPARPGTPPHLTLARLRGRAGLRHWPDPRPLDDATIPLAELALVHSTLGAGGPTYSTLATLPLGGQSAGRR